MSFRGTHASVVCLSLASVVLGIAPVMCIHSELPPTLPSTSAPSTFERRVFESSIEVVVVDWLFMLLLLLLLLVFFFLYVVERALSKADVDSQQDVDVVGVTLLNNEKMGRQVENIYY